MARMHPPRLDGSAATAEAVVHERLARDFDDDWEIFADPMIRARGEEGRVEFVLVNPRLGVALVGLVEDEAEASPEEAAAAMREMLREAGFEDRFIGRLPIVALVARPEKAGELRRRVAEGFARQKPLSIPGSTWAEFVIDRLRPTGAALPLGPRADALPRGDGVRLRPPSRDDAWRVYAEAGTGGAAAVERAPMPLALDDGRLAASADERRSYLWPAVGLALCTVIGILVGMAVMQHTHGAERGTQQEAASRPL
jgi:hypothetical protein